MLLIEIAIAGRYNSLIKKNWAVLNPVDVKNHDLRNSYDNNGSIRKIVICVEYDGDQWILAIIIRALRDAHALSWKLANNLVGYK